MNDQQRIDICRKIAVNPQVNHTNFELHDHVDYDRFKVDPNVYRLTYDGITAYIGVVFGDISAYEDEEHNWDNVYKRVDLPDELRYKVDQALVAYHRSLSEDFHDEQL